MRIVGVVVALVGLLVIDAVPSLARTPVVIRPESFSLRPEQCWGKACTRRVEFSCSAGSVRIAVDIPWSRYDLWPAEFAGETTRITFGDASYRTSYEGQIVAYYKNRHVARVMVVMLASPSDNVFTILRNSGNIYVAGRYGSFRVKTTALTPSIERLREACQAS